MCLERRKGGGKTPVGGGEGGRERERDSLHLKGFKGEDFREDLNRIFISFIAVSFQGHSLF